jgi:FkbM family methyltransferase
MLRDAIDLTLLRVGRPLLRAEMGDFALHGFLRHRSFIEGINQRKREVFFRDLFENSLKPGMTVVDGGAHIGLYTLLASPRVGSSGRVLAFEPDPWNFAALVHNIRKSGCGNVLALQKALSNNAGKATFWSNSGTISSSLFNRGNRGPSRPLEIWTTPLDDALKGSTVHSLLVKLDVEGAELLAIRGMGKILSESRSATLFMEINPAALCDAGVESEEIVTDLRRLGFEVFFIEESRRELVELKSPRVHQKGNLYCRKET